jgi:prepilin-type N-terminal cleavage/methylation domain-containing protein
MMTILYFIKNRFAGMPETGFTLVELIVTLVLVGIIGTFTTLFVYTGLNGYLMARDTSEGALKAQITLDRISMELRDIDTVGTFTENTQIDYTSRSLGGNRQILYSNGVISIDGGIGARNLLDGVQNFSMTLAQTDLNGDGTDDIQAINVSFNTDQIDRQFSARIFPRYMVLAP